MSGILLGLIALCYVAPAIFQSFGGDPTWFFYISRGFSGACIFWLLGKGRSRLLSAICSFGAVCEGLTSVCGLAYWAKPVVMAPWQNLCDASTGLPVTPLVLVIFAVFAMLISCSPHKRNNL